jgi:hypothetical protein
VRKGVISLSKGKKKSLRVKMKVRRERI